MGGSDLDFFGFIANLGGGGVMGFFFVHSWFCIVYSLYSWHSTNFDLSQPATWRQTCKGCSSFFWLLLY